MKQYCVDNGKFRLEDYDPGDTDGFNGGKEQALAELEKLGERLATLQNLLYAEKKHKLLVVLQAPDAGGKDGTIRVVFDRVNPTGVRVASFGLPTEKELAHDYLWRVHREVPGKGEMVIFNRSHYEDVLVARVRKLVPKAVWERRYRHIREFERMLSDEGTTLLKFFLYVSKNEQKKRLQERLDDPEKRWKFRKGDLEDRALWKQYMQAYEDAIRETGTDYAPWYVIPADHNWFRNWLVSKTIVDTLEGLRMEFPDPEEGLKRVKIK
ncbi:MAG: polyphosphate kinase [Meiothermus sp.]